MEYRRKSSCSIEEKKKNKNNSNVQVNSLYGSSSLRSIVVCYKRERLDEKATTAISMPLYSWWIAFACDCMLYASVFFINCIEPFFPFTSGCLCPTNHMNFVIIFSFSSSSNLSLFFVCVFSRESVGTSAFSKSLYKRLIQCIDVSMYLWCFGVCAFRSISC